MNWNWDLAIEIVPRLLSGFALTLQASLLGFALALALGFVWTMLRRGPRWMRWPVDGAIEFVRGTPLLVQLYVLYYVLPGAGIQLGPMVAGILGLGLHYSTYIAEVLRAGIGAVPQGQWQAAAAVQLRPWDTWTRVILPQAVPPMIPALANRLIAIFKETPLLAAITVPEMLLVAREIGDERFSYLEPYTEVGLFFLAASLIASAGAHLLEKRYGTLEIQ